MVSLCCYFIHCIQPVNRVILWICPGCVLHTEDWVVVQSTPEVVVCVCVWGGGGCVGVGGVVWCGVVWCGVVWCGVVWCGCVVWCGVVWCGVVWCGVCACACGCGVVWCGVCVCVCVCVSSTYCHRWSTHKAPITRNNPMTQWLVGVYYMWMFLIHLEHFIREIFNLWATLWAY